MKARAAAEMLRGYPSDEPVFVLRAQDVLAADTVDNWADRAELRDVRSGKIAGARECAKEMRDWPTRKLPD